MNNKDVGIKKNRGLISFLLILIALAFVITCIFMWWEYGSQERYKYLSENAIEVEATITHYRIFYWPNSNDKDWYTYYEYESEWGTLYQNRAGLFSNESSAAKEVGKKIKIYIDPNSDWSSKVLPSFDYMRALRRAIIWSFPVPFVLYLLLYRCIYRNVLNKKIKKKAYGKFYNNDKFELTPQANSIKNGEVTKVIRWIVCYVKVKYQDENGVEREKWARSWFTHNEAKFLQQQKIINIIPYKNTYGILEEMPTTK